MTGTHERNRVMRRWSAASILALVAGIAVSAPAGVNAQEATFYSGPVTADCRRVE